MITTTRISQVEVHEFRSPAVSRSARWLAPTPPATVSLVPGRNPGGTRWPRGCR